MSAGDDDARQVEAGVRIRTVPGSSGDKVPANKKPAAEEDGGFGWSGSTIDSWLDELLASDRGVNKVRKLGRANASERHLVVVLDSFSQAGTGTPLALTARYERGAAEYGMPSFVPPEPLTHLWLLPTMGTGECLLWKRGGGWTIIDHSGSG